MGVVYIILSKIWPGFSSGRDDQDHALKSCDQDDPSTQLASGRTWMNKNTQTSCWILVGSILVAI